MANKNRKIYVIGPQKSYASWMQGEVIKDMEDADLVVLTGGEDINPALYNQAVGKHTYFNEGRDEFEVQELTKALTLQKPIWGTCRGAQLLCARAGGVLVQDLSHPSRHNITFYDGTEISTTSCHHQLQFPFCISKDKYKILAYAEGLSTVYLNGMNSQMLLPSNDKGVMMEPEFVYYRQLNALGIQGHPEWMAENSTLVTVLRRYIDFLIDGRLDIVTRLEIPIERMLNREFQLTKEEIDQYNLLSNRVKKPELAPERV